MSLTTKTRTIALAFAAVVGLSTGQASAAEVHVSAYSGYITSPHSDVDTSGASFPGSTSFHVGWEGKPFEMPPFWGARVTYWPDRWQNWGFALDFAHSKVYSELNGAVAGVYDKLEFTDGLNLITGNVIYRYQMDSRFTPYAGVGAGIAVPHVEVEFDGSAGRTYEYQMTGPTVQALVGTDIAITENVSTFLEYKFNYSWNEADLAEGGTLETNIINNQFIVGLTYKFNPRGSEPVYEPVSEPVYK